MQRPLIFDYKDFGAFVRDMSAYRRIVDPRFSILKSCEALERCSPALISGITHGKRRISIDRVDDIAQILSLTHQEKLFLKQSLSRKLQKQSNDEVKKETNRNNASASLLKNWLNPYVKDALLLKQVKAKSEALFSVLGGIATRKAIEKSLQYLHHHGYIMMDEKGKWVESAALHIVNTKNRSLEVQSFHRKALHIAKLGLVQHPISERFASTRLLPLDAKAYSELCNLIEDFANTLHDFSEVNNERGDRLYQLIIHLTPAGGTGV